MSKTAAGLQPSTNADVRSVQRIAQAIADLDSWLESMRQSGGYGGPVAHWWRHSLLYAGPGLDWRYEGILTGYATLYRKTLDNQWLQRIRVALSDLLDGELSSGGFRASEFEINPGTLGTPHEAAAVLGMLNSIDCVEPSLRDRILILAESILRNIIDKLWDEHSRGFNDRPGIPGRVPNKLATLGEALLKFANETGQLEYLDFARACLDDVLRYQLSQGPNVGAVHQYGPGAGVGDGRLFPYYNARCIPGLLCGQEVFGDSRYGASAALIVEFLERTLESDHWPQIVYTVGGVARWPSWIAGSGDIIRSLGLMGVDVFSHAALFRLLNSQLSSGGFPTAQGFAKRGSSTREPAASDWLDVLPVCGWNDKVFRLLTELLPEAPQIPAPTVGTSVCEALFHGIPATVEEDQTELLVRAGERVMVRWTKRDPWVSTQFRPPSL